MFFLVFFRRITGDPPFMAATEEELFELIKKGELPFTHTNWQNVSQAGKPVESTLNYPQPYIYSY